MLNKSVLLLLERMSWTSLLDRPVNDLLVNFYHSASTCLEVTDVTNASTLQLYPLLQYASHVLVYWIQGC